VTKCLKTTDKLVLPCLIYPSIVKAIKLRRIWAENAAKVRELDIKTEF
jgi:hypothetical protein